MLATKRGFHFGMIFPWNIMLTWVTRNTLSCQPSHFGFLEPGRSQRDPPHRKSRTKAGPWDGPAPAGSWDLAVLGGTREQLVLSLPSGL